MTGRNCCVLLILLLAAPVVAEEPGSRLDLSSPRATMRTFIESFPRDGPQRPERAIQCIDWSMLNLQEQGKIRRARLLKMIIDRLELFDPEFSTVPDSTLSKWFHPKPVGGYFVSIASNSPTDPTVPWLFTPATIANVDAMWEVAEGWTPLAGTDSVDFSLSPALWIRRRMPGALRDRTFLLENWQWLALLVISVLGIVIERLVAVAIPLYVRRKLLKKKLEVGRRAARTGFRPFGILAMALVWWLFIDWVGLPGPAEVVLVIAVRFLAAASGVWAAYRLVDVFSDVLDRKAKSTDTKFDDLLIPLIRKSLKVFVTVIGLVFMASVVNISVTSLLAGLGLGGLAIALAAKDTVSNLFGSLTVILDRPFQVGDWVKIGSTEGSVEEVGFRSTRIRTFYDSQITVPNGNLISAVVDNMGARRYRRLKTVLGLTYDTPPEKMEAFCEGVRELIRRHPYTRKDYFHVYFNGYSAFSLDVLLYVFFEVPDWGTELRERHRLLNDILRLAGRIGVEFAFPTQTLHISRGGEEEATPELPRAEEVEESLRKGKKEARDIVTGTLGDPPRKPGQVRFWISEQENRGESGEDGGE